MDLSGQGFEHLHHNNGGDVHGQDAVEHHRRNSSGEHHRHCSSAEQHRQPVEHLRHNSGEHHRHNAAEHHRLGVVHGDAAHQRHEAAAHQQHVAVSVAEQIRCGEWINIGGAIDMKVQIFLSIFKFNSKY